MPGRGDRVDDGFIGRIRKSLKPVVFVYNKLVRMNLQSILMTFEAIFFQIKIYSITFRLKFLDPSDIVVMVFIGFLFKYKAFSPTPVTDV